MSLVQHVYKILLDALFPLSPEERVLFSYSPEKAYGELPRAPRHVQTEIPSIFAYKDERVAKLVWNIKYKKSNHALAIGGYAVYQELIKLPECMPLSSKQEMLQVHQLTTSFGLEESGTYPLSSSIILIPIPITAKRRRERGFNQCELLLKEVERLDIHKNFIIRNDVLIRTHHNERQTLKDREHRLKDARGIFSVHEKVLADIISTNTSPLFIVIDDVITTGSTMTEAMATLKKAGCTNVRGVSLAH
ncbi:MAG: comF family protein [Parcubacteria bacterium C7867-002]|nr:MAG: comF family protein [Parcubacteria bacterium C7867-002]